MDVKKKRALITGITGQDGAYLAELLLSKNYEVFGTYRRLSSPNFWRLQALNVLDKVTLIPADLNDETSLIEALNVTKPEEVYHLAAQSFVSASFEQPIGTGDITGLGTTRILDAIRIVDKNIKMYQASTSELYGDGTKEMQNEDTRFAPSSPYAAAKLYSFHMVDIYRKGYDLFASNGILFNHESPLRGLEFVTRKITNTAAKISLGLESELRLGNLDAKRDWGFAKDFVEAMWLILQADKPDDFVISTGETHTVREFVEHTFDFLKLDWKKYVKIDPKFFRPVDVTYLHGDCSKAKKVLDWEPKVKFEELVKLMASEDLNRWERWKSGEHFPWDAANYQSESLFLNKGSNIIIS